MKRQNDSLVTTYVSSADLANLDMCKEDKESCANLPEGVLKDILYKHGVDVLDYPVEAVVDTHRAFCTKQPVTCLRYRGVERTDWEWLHSGNASMEVLLQEASVDVREEMLRSMNMDRVSREIISVAKGKKAVHKVSAKGIGKKTVDGEMV